MGQKVNSNSLRLSVNRPWNSKWFEKKTNYVMLVHEDIQIKNYLNTILKNLKLLIGNIEIKRSRNNIFIQIPVFGLAIQEQENYKENQFADKRLYETTL